MDDQLLDRKRFPVPSGIDPWSRTNLAKVLGSSPSGTSAAALDAIASHVDHDAEVTLRALDERSLQFGVSSDSSGPANPWNTEYASRLTSAGATSAGMLPRSRRPALGAVAVVVPVRSA